MMKAALVHDWLLDFGGAERVLDSIHRSFPADVFTLFYDSKRHMGASYANSNISPSFLNRFPFAHSYYRYGLPLYKKGIESFDLSEYQVVLSSSHAMASHIPTHRDQTHICYCHSPIRYAWDMMKTYLDSVRPSLMRGYVKRALHGIREADLEASKSVDYYLANSNFIARRIEEAYGRKVDRVIYPPVDTERFELSRDKGDYYVTVTRLVPYKKVDLMLKAFADLPDKKLVVIGDGPEMKRLKGLAPRNVKLMGYQNASEVVSWVQGARAFVFAALEDFGISPIEAMACGTPVLALGAGGTLETVVHGGTGIHFPEQNKGALIEGIEELEGSYANFDPFEISKYASQFSRARFEKEYTEFVRSKVGGAL